MHHELVRYKWSTLTEIGFRNFTRSNQMLNQDQFVPVVYSYKQDYILKFVVAVFRLNLVYTQVVHKEFSTRTTSCLIPQIVLISQKSNYV